MNTTANKEVYAATIAAYEQLLQDAITDNKECNIVEMEGICSNAYEYINREVRSCIDSEESDFVNIAFLSYDLVRVASKTWEYILHDSASMEFPIKHFFYHQLKETLWKGPQLKARISLLKHIIKWIKEQTPEELIKSIEEGMLS